MIGEDDAPDALGRATVRVGAPRRATTRGRPGERIDRYVVERELGEGGMGRVVVAHDPELDRRVALKLLHTDRADIELRLLREGQAIAKLRHPNVIAVYDVGSHAGEMFIAMELVEGKTLRPWLARPRTWRETVAVFVQIGRGLAAAHAAGLVHRDIKPENVLLGDDGRVVVTDFGLARAVEGAPATRDSPLALDVTTTGATIGTPAYMSPEQLSAGPVDARSDQFAFCIALFEALYGTRPFPGDTLDALRASVTAGQIAAAPRRGVPTRVQRVVLRGLAVAPEDRFPSMDALVGALATAARLPRWPFVAAAVIAAAAAVGFALRPSAARCEDGASLLAGQWDGAARVGLVAKLAGGSPSLIDATLAIYDRSATAIASLADQTCRARDEIGERAAVVTRSCLQRRAFELGGKQRATLRGPADPRAAWWRLQWLAPPEICRELDAPAMTAPPDEVAALFDRAGIDSNRLGGPDERLTYVAALERDGERLGEAEIAARAVCLAAVVRLGINDLTGATRDFTRCNGQATAIHDGNLAASALLGRAQTMLTTGDNAGARSVAQSALELADHSVVARRTRASTHWVAGRTDKLVGKLADAVAHLEQALAIVAEDPRALVDVELNVDLDLIDALGSIDGRQRDALARARDGVAKGARYDGPDKNLQTSMLEMYAQALDANNLPRQAIEQRRTALARCSQYRCAEIWEIGAKIRLATDLCDLGNWRDARVELEPIRDHIASDPKLVEERAHADRALACATFAGGDLDGAIRLYARALDQYIAQFGKAHPATIAVRSMLVEAELEHGELVAADRQIAELAAAIRDQPAKAVRLATLEGSQKARLELAHKRPAAAEALARAALAKLTDDADREEVLATLGASLVDQHRFAEAREPLEQARAIAMRVYADRREIAALVDVDLARAEAGLGHRDAARARARAARDALPPGRVLARRAAAAVLR